MEQPQDWYFTFGYGHAYPKGYVKIHGTVESSCAEMTARYGAKWCTSYTWDRFEPQIAKYGLTEVKE